ncbi:MAG TPA: T9SS type B sorting domain-containing protein [Bacteroidia bacterium]|jgi:gliding motility-associated-like protein
MKNIRLFLFTLAVLPAAAYGQCSCNNMGPELVVNGDFSQGNTGFTTTYTYSSYAWPGNYGITPDASLPNPGSWSPCNDHTTGTGNLLWVDASSSGYGLPMWTENFPVNPNTNYVFSFWFENVNNDSISNPPGTVQFSINNQLLGNLLTAPNLSCQWVQACVVWNSGNNTSASISIMNMAAYFNGNDFGFDDISFRECNSSNCNITAAINPPVTICAGQSTTLTATGGTQYTWSPSQGLSSTSIANPVATPLTTTTYMVIVSNGQCSDTAYTTISVNPIPVPNVTQPSAVCTGGNVNLSASGGSAFSWAPSTNLSSTTVPNPVCTPNANTTYTVTVSDAGCSATATVTVNVVAPPTPTGQDQTVCGGQTVQLQVSGATSYSWIPSTGLSNANIANPQATVTSTTVYTVIASNGTCTATTNVTVNVSAPPTAVITASSTSGEAPLTVNFEDHSLNAASTLFIVGNGDTTIQGNFSMTFADTGSYTVYLIAWNGNGCPDTTAIVIDVTPSSSIFVPNAFTPQGDGLNDIFQARSTGIVEFQAWIFDRWGNLFYTWTDKDGGWDGRYNGTLVQEDVYVWKIRARGIEGKHYSMVGHVSVIR